MRKTVLLLMVVGGCGRSVSEGTPETPSSGGANAALGGAGAGRSGAMTTGMGATAGATAVSTGGVSTSGGSDAAAGGDAGGPAVGVPYDDYAVTGSWPERSVALETKPGKLEYTKIQVHDRFLAYSCTIGDYDLDGHPDVSSGRRWYSGPDFKIEHAFRGGHEDVPKNTSYERVYPDDIADYALDMDGDGDADIINVAHPSFEVGVPDEQGQGTAYWYENPGPGLVASTSQWSPHLIHTDVRGEQHAIADVDGDGTPELLGACSNCRPQSTKGYYRVSTPLGGWTYQAVTRQYEFPYGGTGLLHGFGFGDLTGDGRPDLLERGGVWVDVASPEPNVVECPGAGCGWLKMALDDGSALAHRGGAQMFTFDVDGDGDADVVSGEDAHGYGLSWYEQTKPFALTRHQILGGPTDPVSVLPPVFSESHALEAVDMDGDGVPDLVTGKSWHVNPPGFGDKDPEGAPVLYVFRTLRDTPNAVGGGSVTFEPHLVDSEVGVGMQIGVGHLNGDGVMDLCVATQLGLYVFLGQ